MTIVEIDASGLRMTILGPDISQNQVLQHVVPANTWFGSFPNEGSEYSFVGCTVSPGFDFADFELASREALIKEHPDAAVVIEQLTIGLP